MTHCPSISVIIPTHNRSALLKKTLDALSVQSYPFDAMEVLVVADGCVDSTLKMLQPYKAPFSLRVLEQPCRGPAAARNHGAVLALGGLLIFIDDDVEITPSFVERHAQAHENATGAVIGYLVPVFQGRLSFFQIELRLWYQAMFEGMRQKGHRYTYDNFLTGNCSIKKEVFETIGRFDPDFSCHEDYEFGLKLIKSGFSINFEPRALGYHHVTTTLEESLERKYQEGRADVLLGLRHPEIRTTLLMARWMTGVSLTHRILPHLAFACPGTGEALISIMRSLLPALERVHFRRYWRFLVGNMMGYWYWRGVAGEFTSQKALADFLRGGLPAHQRPKEIAIDLKEGLEKAEHRLDMEQPESVYLRYGQEPVGRIPPRPEAEPLRGAHLRSILAREMPGPLLKALALDGVIGYPPEYLWKAPFMKPWGQAGRGNG